MHPSVRNQTDEPRNPNYEEDIVYVTKYVKWILNFIGIWPAMLKGIGRFLPKIVIVLSNFVLVFFEVQCILHITLEQKDPMLRMRIVGLAYYTLVCLMKYWAMTMRKSRIRFCIEEVYTDWKQVEHQRHRTLMLKYGKTARDLTMYCAVFVYCGNMFYIAILQYAVGSQIDADNRTIRILMYPMYNGLFDVQKTPTYEIVYILQCICTIMLNTVTAGCSGLAALFATHACGQIDVIVSQLDDLVDGKFARKNFNPDTRLTEIVQHHMRILKYNYKDSLQRLRWFCRRCFLEFIGSAFQICFLEYYCIMDWQENNKFGLMTYSFLLISVSFNLFLLCYIGDLLLEKSANIGISCCMIDWYRLPSKTTQGIILIIAMSCNPMKITAGGIVYISLPIFGNVLKTSFAYLNFIQSAVL